MKKALLAFVLFLSISDVFAFTGIEISNSDYLDQVRAALVTFGSAVVCGNNGNGNSNGKDMPSNLVRLGNINENLVRLFQKHSGKIKIIASNLEQSANLMSQTCLTIQSN